MIRMGASFIFTITPEELAQLGELIRGDRSFSVSKVDHWLYEVTVDNEAAAVAFGECLRIVVDAECAAMHAKQVSRVQRESAARL